MLFDRVKPLDAILATAEKKSLTRTLGAFQLTMLGIGAVIGTGIFVLTAEAAQKAGPGMMISFIIAGFVCAFAALCYAEMASMVPVSGSAYTYSYAVMGELIAWMVGWALILEYAVAAGGGAGGGAGFVGGLGGEHEDSGANDGADPQHGELEWPQRAVQRLLLGSRKNRVERFNSPHISSRNSGGPRRAVVIWRYVASSAARGQAPTHADRLRQTRRLGNGRSLGAGTRPG